MSVTITKRPDATTTSLTKTGRWLAVNAEYPVVFNLQRRDYLDINYSRNNDDTLNIFIINVDLSGEVKAGDYIYIHSEQYGYIDNSYEVGSITSTGSGTNIVTAGAVAGTWAADYDADNFINVITSRVDHRVKVEIINAVTLRQIGSANYVGYNSGLIQLDVSEWVKLPLDISTDFSNINEANKNTSQKFYIKYTELTGSTSNEVTDTFVYTAVSGAMQLQDTNAPNMLAYTCFNADLAEAEKGKFLTVFKNPRHWVGYPAKYAFIVESEGSFPDFDRVEETFNKFENPTGTTTDQLVSPDFRYLNFATLAGNYGDTVTDIDLSIGSDITPTNSCGKLEDDDWKYSAWTITGGYVAGIKLEPNAPASLISAVTSYPNGKLYRDGTEIDDLIYNSSTGVYEPQDGTANIIFSGTMKAEILSVPLTTTAGEACTLSFSQELVGFASSPQALNVALALQSGSLPIEGSVLQGSYTFSDIDGDSEGTSILSIRKYDSDTLADADTDGTGGTEVSTTSTYTVLLADVGKYFRFWVTPVSTIAPTTGVIAGSTKLGPVEGAIATLTTTKQTSFTLTLTLLTGVSYLVNWGDGSEQSVSGLGTNAYSHTYASAGSYDVKVFGSSSGLTGFAANDQGLTALSVADANHLTLLTAKDNTALASFTAPSAHAASFTDFSLENTGLVTATLTNLSFSASPLHLHSSSSLTSFNLTGSTGTLTEFRFDLCDITGAASVPSGLNMENTLSTNAIYGNDNSNMTSFDMSNMTGKMAFLYLDNCGISGGFNFGSIEGTNLNCRLQDNQINQVDQTNFTGTFNALNLSNNSLSGQINISAAFSTIGANELLFSGNSASLFSVNFTGSSGNLSSLRFDNSKILAVSCSVYNFVGCVLTALQCPNLSAFNVVGCTGSLSFFYVYGSSLLDGTVDLSAFEWGVDSYIRIDGTDVSGLLFKPDVGSGRLTLFSADGADLTGTIDFTNWEFNSTLSLILSNNPLLTMVDLSGCSGTINEINLSDCDITGVIDASAATFNFVSSGASLYANGNANMTGFRHANGMTGTFSLYQLQGTQCIRQTDGLGSAFISLDAVVRFDDCGLSATEVDNWFVEFGASVPVSGTATGSINGAGTNAAPTGTSSGSRTNLTNRGYTLTIS